MYGLRFITVLSPRSRFYHLFHISTHTGLCAITISCVLSRGMSHLARSTYYPHRAYHIYKISTHEADSMCKKICLRGGHANALINILYFVVIEFYRIDITLLLTIYHINITAYPYFTTIMKR